MPLTPGQTTLAAIRTTVQQRCDRVNDGNISTSEWNSYIASSHQELYDLLVQKYGDNYFVQTPATITTDGTNDQYALPTDFFKLLGVDQLVSGSPNGFISLRPFNFPERNRYSALNYSGSWFGRTNLRYRLNANSLWLTPMPTAGLTIRVWYVPRLTVAVNDADVIDGVNGWEEYIVVDTIIKARLKGEEDPTAELALKQALTKRIEEAAENRDAGSPATVVDIHKRGGAWADPFGDDY